MAEGNQGWEPEAVHRLLADLRRRCAATDEDFLHHVVGLLEDVTDLDAAERDQAYEDAFDRAFSTLKPAKASYKADHKRLAKALALLQVREPRTLRPLWRYYGWPLVQAHLTLSFEARYRDPQQMLSSAIDARDVAAKTEIEEYPPGLVFDLRARASIELANAYRVNDRFDAAESSLATAEAWLNQGTGDIALQARLLDVEASLRLEQRRLSQASELLDRAKGLYSEIGELHLVGRTLISQARVVFTGGDPAGAVRLLEEGMALLDPERDPRLVHTTLQSILLGLVDSGDYSRAGKLYLESGLREAFAKEPLNLQRLRWVEGRIHAGMDRLDRAEPIFREVRTYFREASLEYDAALVGLDLAAIWLRQGQAGRLLPLAVEMSQTFRRLQLPTQEAWAALTFLEMVCAHRLENIGIVERTRSFLVRLQADPTLEFDARSVFLG